jgi:hypothetical protein
LLSFRLVALDWEDVSIQVFDVLFGVILFQSCGMVGGAILSFVLILEMKSFVPLFLLLRPVLPALAAVQDGIGLGLQFLLVDFRLFG